MALQLSSPAFDHEADIPRRFTCEGEDVSPPLDWTGAPEETRSFVLIVHDPDAPRGDWLHWMAFDIPAGSGSLPEDASLPQPAREGANDFGNYGYGGPCPPHGSRHRYFFELYALDTELGMSRDATLDELRNAMEGRILARAELVGTYAR